MLNRARFLLMDTEKWIETPYGQIRLIESGKGFPLLLVHGLFSSLRTFENLFSYKQDRFRLIAFDLPGNGKSIPAPGFSPSWETYAHLVMLIANELNLKSFNLLGHSMGGGISTVVAARNPERINQLALVDAVTLPYDVPLKGRIPLLPIIGPFIFTKLYGRQMFINYFRNDVFFDAKALNREKVESDYLVFDRYRNLALEAVRATADPSPILEHVDSIKCPTLLLWGDKDTLVPLKVGRALCHQIVGSTLKIVYDCGHSPIEECPVEVPQAIFEYMEVPATF